MPGVAGIAVGKVSPIGIPVDISQGFETNSPVLTVISDAETRKPDAGDRGSGVEATDCRLEPGPTAPVCGRRASHRGKCSPMQIRRERRIRRNSAGGPALRWSDRRPRRKSARARVRSHQPRRCPAALRVRNRLSPGQATGRRLPIDEHSPSNRRSRFGARAASWQWDAIGLSFHADHYVPSPRLRSKQSVSMTTLHL